MLNSNQVIANVFPDKHTDQEDTGRGHNLQTQLNSWQQNQDCASDHYQH